MSSIIVNIGGVDTVVNVEKKNIKNMYVRVKDGVIYVSCNKITSNKDIIRIISEHENFIIKRINETKKENIIHFFGKPYQPVFLLGKPNVYIEDTNMFIVSKENTKDKQKETLYKFYKSELEKCIDFLTVEAKNDFNEIKFPTIKYRVLKGSFGNYNRIKNEITLSVLLAKYDCYYIKSVLYHELSHTYVLNHGSEFYSVYESKFKGAKKAQHELRHLGYKDIF